MNDGGHGIAKFRPFKIKGVSSMRWPLIALAAVFVLVAGGLSPMLALAQTPPDHYDADGDGLIEIDSLTQLNAVRWDLDGNGAADNASNDADYAAAFPVAENGSVCPAETDCAGYELTANLDFDENNDGEITEADAAYWNNGAGWLPIGRQGVTALNDGSTSPRDARLFHVTFDGNGHTIANLFADRSTKNTQGLFSVLGTGAEVRNLGLPGVDVTADRYAGGLAGWSQMETSITASWATGKVVGTYDTGGLIGETFGSATRCWAAVDVTGGLHAGGLVGENEISGSITDSYATGKVVGTYDVGGLVGFNAAEFGGERKGVIIRSYATGSVSGDEDVGGLVGANDGTIKSSYAMSTVSGNTNVGGLVGDNELFTAHGDTIEGTIQGSYAVGTVSGDSHVGGVVGYNSGRTISGYYYDSDVFGRVREGGKSTAELTAPTGYTGIYAGWNLDLDNADGDDDDSTGGDDPWHFGTASQYPVLKADFNGDGTATWQEFGYQVRERPILTARVAGPRVFLRWNPADASHWENPPIIAYALYRNGQKVAGYDGSSTSYTDTGLTVGQTYTYHVATLLNGVEARRSNRAAATPESAPNNHDVDGDGLIEINSLAKLNAVRWDLDGDGMPAEGNETDYAVAFPVAEDGAVCPAGTTCAGYELTANLDFDENGDEEITAADATYWNEGRGWEPIGVQADPFIGIFEGNDHTIANLFIDRMDIEFWEGFFLSFTNQALFYELGSAGEIRNLGMTDVDVAGGDYAAGLVGWSNGTISGCYVTGKVAGTYDTGGLTGENWHVIRGSYADVTVSGGKHAGGLTGENEHSGKIFNSYATGAVSGKEDTGGLVGYTEPGSSIIGSYATGAVNGESRSGGLVGHNNGATISASYATGSVTGLVGYSGGLVGLNDGTVTASYATGAASAQGSVGGLAGRNGGSITASYATGTAIKAVGDRQLGKSGLVDVNLNGTITASYHDSETSGHSAGSYGKTSAELQTPRGYTGIYSAWNVDLDGDSTPDNPWDFGTDQQYPALKVDFNGDNAATWQEFGYQSRLTATASGTQIELSWNGMTPSPTMTASSIAYVLYRDGVKVADYDGSSTSYTDTGLTLGQTYTYQVATLLNGDETQRSNQVTLEAAESDPDRDALTAVYDATGGANWTYNKNWLSAEPLGRWGGVTTNDEGRVIALDLPNNNLRGSLPEEISDLSELQVLMIRENRGLSGPLPLSMAGMSSLTHLYADLTQVCAPDDAAVQEWLDGLTKVRIEDCPDDRDRAVLIEFYNATNGPDWTSSDNWLSDKPLHEWAGVKTNHLGRVTRLTLHERNLNGTIPESFGNLTELRQPYLYDNDLKGPLPASIGNLTELWIATLGGNEFTGPLPEGLGNLTNLEELRLQNNRLTGSLPASLGNLKKLELLYLHRQVDENGNGGLTGSIPASMGSMTSLQELVLDRNNLSGSIPVDLGNLSNLRRFAANRNQLTGAIPTQLGNLRQLQVLGLANNDLSGTLPSELGNLKHLERLSLHDNEQLTGSLPSGIEGLSKLYRLAISNTGLSGTLPSNLTNLGAMRQLFFDGTGLCAPTDNAFQNWLNGISEKRGNNCR